MDNHSLIVAELASANRGTAGARENSRSDRGEFGTAWRKTPANALIFLANHPETVETISKAPATQE